MSQAEAANAITGPAAAVLKRLHAEASREEPGPLARRLAPILRPLMFWHKPDLSHAYMAVSPDQGRLLFNLVRATHARNIVEFGASYGISTIYLASGVMDPRVSGGYASKFPTSDSPPLAITARKSTEPGITNKPDTATESHDPDGPVAAQCIVTTTELEPHKCADARANFREAVLDGRICLLEGDALETLRDNPAGEIDFVFLDGTKSIYLDVLALLEPRLRPGSLVVADNAELPSARPYVDHMLSAGGRYSTVLLPMQRSTMVISLLI